MGVTFLFGYTTLCSTAILFLYFSLTTHFAIHVDYEVYQPMKREPDKLPHESVKCHSLNSNTNARRSQKKQTFQINHEYPPRSETLEFVIIPFLKTGYNKAQFRNNMQCIQPCDHPGSVIFVTNVIALGDNKHKSNLQFQDRKPSNVEIDARWREIINTLQRNLDHEELKAVAVLVEDKRVAQTLLKLDFRNSEKLIIQNANGVIRMTDSFDYGTRCFKDEIIAVGNQDIIFGTGWDALDSYHLKNTKSIYALTRHNSLLNKFCYGNPRTGVCDIDYSWAHDAFVFHVKQRIKHKHFPVLHSRVYNVYGGENIVIWTFRNVLQYRVTNPCSILKVHHEHCVPIRNKRKREGNTTIWATAEFTKTLY